MDSWNAWHDWFGNTPDGSLPLLAARRRRLRARPAAIPEVERTATVLVQLTGGSGRRRLA